jgi:hypothetical protein
MKKYALLLLLICIWGAVARLDCVTQELGQLEAAFLGLAALLQSPEDEDGPPPPLPPRSEPVLDEKGDDEGAAGTATGKKQPPPAPPAKPPSMTVPPTSREGKPPAPTATEALETAQLNKKISSSWVNQPQFPENIPSNVMINKLIAQSNAIASYQRNTVTGKLKIADHKKTKQAVHQLLHAISRELQQPSNLKAVRENDTFKQVIAVMLERIAYIDPLVIATVAKLFEKLGFDNNYVNRFIVNLYKNCVDFIVFEFGQIKKGVVALGVREDIDEAFCYAVELNAKFEEEKRKAEARNAAISQLEQKVAKDKKAEDVAELTKLKAAPVSDDEMVATSFVKGMQEQQQRLLDLFTSSSGAINDDKIKEDVKAYIAMLTPEPRSYCLIYDTSAPYINLYQDLYQIEQDIDAYKSTDSRSKRIFTIQKIINKLHAFCDYARAPNFCQTCLNRDIKILQLMRDGLVRRHESKENVFAFIKDTFIPKYGPSFKLQFAKLDANRVLDYEAVLHKISDFLKTINGSEKNATIQDAIDTYVPQMEQLLKQDVTGKLLAPGTK